MNRPLGTTTTGSAAAVVAYEFFHLLGLPDLYDIAAATAPTARAWFGTWAHMSSSTSNYVSA